MMIRAIAALVVLGQLGVATFSGNAWAESTSATLTLGNNERLITILSTNDMHGGIYPQINANGEPVGGMAFWAGAVRAIKQGLANQFGERAGVAVVDGGDQFQGTLLSNFNEGQLMFAAMTEVGYDAAVPGNHDFDFGPVGWLEDKVTPQTTDQNPRGALDRLTGQVPFALISANTYLKSSLTDRAGRALEVSNAGCNPNSASRIEWSRAQRPAYAQPYVIKQIAGVRVALIGLDSVHTPSTTAIENISDLCFRDERETYLEIRDELEGKADVFVLIMHNGDIAGSNDASRIVSKILSGADAGTLHAVIGAHTHQVNNARIQGIPFIQSGSNVQKFGRIDLIWDTKTKAVKNAKTRVFAGTTLFGHHCSQGIASFCTSAIEGQVVGGVVAYEGVTVVPSEAVNQYIQQGRNEIAPLATRKLGIADAVIKRDRLSESPLADGLTDAFRIASGADVAFMNTGGIRDNLPAGDITYEQFFDVLPFNNRGVIVSAMPVGQLLSLLQRSIESCGSYGPLMQSGLRVTFRRNCTSGQAPDAGARLLKVQTLSGEVLLDANAGISPPVGRTFKVATLDYLISSASGWAGFHGLPISADIGIVREVIANSLMMNPVRFSPRIDGRWTAVNQQSWSQYR